MTLSVWLGTTRSRHRARMPSVTCGAARVSPWGQRAPRGVQAFDLLLPPGSDAMFRLLITSCTLRQGPSVGHRGLKRTTQTFFLSPGIQWRTAPCLHIWLTEGQRRWQVYCWRGGESIMCSYLKSLKAGVCGSLHEWVILCRHYVGGAEGQPKLTHLNNSSNNSSHPAPTSYEDNENLPKKPKTVDQTLEEERTEEDLSPGDGCGGRLKTGKKTNKKKER